MYVYPSLKGLIKKYHKTDHLFTFKSGAMIEFKTYEDEMAARGSKRKRLFINELNSLKEGVYFQLDSRSEQTIVDYNPSARFYCHDSIIGQPGTELLISDHRHNPFLTIEKHREIEAYTGERFRVYSRGLTGNIQGVVFPNWQIIDDLDFPKESELDIPFVFSIDFGYTNDPTAIIKQVLIGKTLFVKEIAYETGLPAINIMQILKANGFKSGFTPLYCEHDKDMIRDLRKHGATYADFATKGPGSIKAGIQLLNQYDVRYTCSSRNIHRERPLYIYETTKDGILTNEPEDKHNHTFDAIRYGAYTRYLKNH